MDLGSHISPTTQMRPYSKVSQVSYHSPETTRCLYHQIGPFLALSPCQHTLTCFPRWFNTLPVLPGPASRNMSQSHQVPEATPSKRSDPVSLSNLFSLLLGTLSRHLDYKTIPTALDFSKTSSRTPDPRTLSSSPGF